MDVIECRSCGGRIVFDADREVARCIFCASVELAPRSNEQFDQPELAIPFGFPEARAETRFVAWASSSWWHPKALRSAKVELTKLWIPAWRFEARVEAHYAGLQSNHSTKSGKKPVSGVDVSERDAWVPASLGLSTEELNALIPFHDDEAVEFAPDANDPTPFETNGLSRPAALSAARRSLADDARNEISRRERLADCRVVGTLEDVRSQLLLLPIYIGSFRFRDRPWRFIVNAQTGHITGDAPIDRRKIAIVFAIVALAAMIWWIWAGRV